MTNIEKIQELGICVETTHEKASCKICTYGSEKPFKCHGWPEDCEEGIEEFLEQEAAKDD